MDSHAGKYEDYDSWRVAHSLAITRWGFTTWMGALVALIASQPAAIFVGFVYTLYCIHMMLAVAADGYNRTVYEWYSWGDYTPIYDKRPTGPEYETAADKLDYGKRI